MKNLTKLISEDVMIAEFLKAEFASSRFHSKINQSLVKYNATAEIILGPDLENDNENSIRMAIFSSYREYESSNGLFEGFPKDIQWFESNLTKNELLHDVYYINYSYWKKLTNRSRLPIDAVSSLKNNIEIFEKSNKVFFEASMDFQNGKKFEKLILVTNGTRYVVLEGHLRLTVYALNRKILPESIPVIIGYSKHIGNWNLF